MCWLILLLLFVIGVLILRRDMNYALNLGFDAEREIVILIRKILGFKDKIMNVSFSISCSMFHFVQFKRSTSFKYSMFQILKYHKTDFNDYC